MNVQNGRRRAKCKGLARDYVMDGGLANGSCGSAGKLAWQHELDFGDRPMLSRV